jgi:hypothetical protein
MILDMMNALIRQQFDRMFEGDDKAVKLAGQAFDHFDRALANEAAPGPARWLGKTAVGFIFGGNLDCIVPHPERFETWMETILLPMRVLGQIHVDAKPIMAGLR